LDNFKVYNDTLGHQEGDQILIQIAKILNSSARKQDTIYRYGGEEFAVLLLHTNKQEARVVAEKIRMSIEQSDFRKQEIFPNRKLTVSLGIAAYPDDAASKDSLLEHADKALYAAKHQGKNRACD